MSRRLGVSELLNPAETVNARNEIMRLQQLFSRLNSGPVLVSPQVCQHLQSALACWGPQPLAPATHRDNPGPPAELTIEHNVKISSKTTLKTLYRHPPGTVVEYPTSSAEGTIRHLFHVDPQNWYLPWVNFAYSRGSPDRGTKLGETFSTPLLVDQNGDEVDCQTRHSTCQGIKACPFGDLTELCKPHTEASREDIQKRLADDREARLELSSPQRDVFQRTASFITAVQALGCRRPPQEATQRTPEELEVYEAEQMSQRYYRRGYPMPPSCDGRIVYHEPLERNHVAYLSCEHYNPRTNRHHWADFTIGDGRYNLEYIAAVFMNNTNEAAEIEQAAAQEEHGPLAVCTMITNHSNQKVYCPINHRDNEGHLGRKPMVRLKCHVKYRIWYSVEEDRSKCPYVLITSHEKTPKGVREQTLSLLHNLREDLPDMTARRFLRHPATKSYLYNKFPDISHPTLSHLHPSLANRSHLSAYITRVKKEDFPAGTDWKGVLRLQQLQDQRLEDQELPPEDRYIRLVLELDDGDLPVHEEDDPALPGQKKTRIIICMSPDNSRRLQKTGAYIQSDIGFKHIVGFDEFELAAMDRDANTSKDQNRFAPAWTLTLPFSGIIFCRVYLNRQTAAAHQRIFQEIEHIVYTDTGGKLRWRHLHARSLGEYEGMILHWAADQHHGQAKGLGLHLVSLAGALPENKMDLHEPHRSLCSLGPYEHLKRLFRLCFVHNFRNIKTCAVPEPVHEMMRSLTCISHPNWDETIEKIKTEGGKTAQDWIRDKESCKFAFAGLCWEKSFIPLAIWQAGEAHSNLIESVHCDVNREGIHCTLLGGLLKGQQFDVLKAQTLKEWETHGIRPTYQPVTSVVNALKHVKRKGCSTRHQHQEAQ
ncbi:hypothetical protein FB451DRAFT_1170708 [Mycena latifolia]|nr:hypothetical protein FB451DRAFT_1170708 [Mycena latifolia]